MTRCGKCDICGKKNSPLVPCGSHWHFKCARCQTLSSSAVAAPKDEAETPKEKP